MKTPQDYDFHALHNPIQPLVLINCWDAGSAAVVQSQGATALATSSAAVAWANGYPDGDALPREVLLQSMRAIMRVAKVPVTVDIESGYSNSPLRVAQLVAELAVLGVVGVNLEDGAGSVKHLVDKIESIRADANLDPIFINARTDVYLRNLVAPDAYLTETLRRQAQYADSGADGLFVPGLSDPKMVARLLEQISLPLNLMAASVSQVSSISGLGVSRISLGPLPWIAAMQILQTQTRTVIGAVQNDLPLDYERVNAMLSRV